MSKKLTSEQCKFHPNCTKPNCPYQHPGQGQHQQPSQLQQIKPLFGNNAGNNTKEVECVFYKQNKCTAGDNCKFKHSEPQSQQQTQGTSISQQFPSSLLVKSENPHQEVPAFNLASKPFTPAQSQQIGGNPQTQPTAPQLTIQQMKQQALQAAQKNTTTPKLSVVEELKKKALEQSKLLISQNQQANNSLSGQQQQEPSQEQTQIAAPKIINLNKSNSQQLILLNEMKNAQNQKKKQMQQQQQIQMQQHQQKVIEAQKKVQFIQANQNANQGSKSMQMQLIKATQQQNAIIPKTQTQEVSQPVRQVSQVKPPQEVQAKQPQAVGGEQQKKTISLQQLKQIAQQSQQQQIAQQKVIQQTQENVAEAKEEVKILQTQAIAEEVQQPIVVPESIVQLGKRPQPEEEQKDTSVSILGENSQKRQKLDEVPITGISSGIPEIASQAKIPEQEIVQEVIPPLTSIPQIPDEIMEEAKEEQVKQGTEDEEMNQEIDYQSPGENLEAQNVKQVEVVANQARKIQEEDKEMQEVQANPEDAIHESLEYSNLMMLLSQSAKDESFKDNYKDLRLKVFKKEIRQHRKAGIIAQPQHFDIQDLVKPYQQEKLASFHDVIDVYSQVSSNQDSIQQEEQPSSHNQQQITNIHSGIAHQPHQEQSKPVAPLSVPQNLQQQVPSEPSQIQSQFQAQQAQPSTAQQQHQQSVPEQPKKKITTEMLLKEIDDFNALLDKIQNRLQLRIPKALYQDDDPEHDKVVSFQTKVDCIVEFFDNKADAYAEKAKAKVQEIKQ